VLSVSSTGTSSSSGLGEHAANRSPPWALVADDDPGRVQVVVQRAALTEELRGEDDAVGAELRTQARAVKPTGTVDLMTMCAVGVMP
jgi:hypothetical protein